MQQEASRPRSMVRKSTEPPIFVLTPVLISLNQFTIMAVETSEIKASVKAYILDEFLPGESPEALTEDLALISGGILDSIATVKLVGFLEDKYSVSFAAHEMSADYLDTIEDIAAIVDEKQ